MLALAKHRTKREIAQLVRTLNPLPDVPAVVEPLGPVPAGGTGIPVPRNPAWGQFVASRGGPVRELSPGDRPQDWIDNDAGDALVEPEQRSLEANPCAGSDTDDASQLAPSALAPQRYKVQFTATQEYVDLLEEARDLLSHAVSGRSLEQVHLRAMRSLVTELRKLRYAATAEPHPTASDSGDTDTDTEAAPELAAEPGSSRAQEEQTRTPPMRSAVEAPTDPRRRGRYISAAVRRAVWKRDGGRCVYVGPAGQRCRETAFRDFMSETKVSQFRP